LHQISLNRGIYLAQPFCYDIATKNGAQRSLNILKRSVKIMAEFASKGVAGTGLGLGIAGTALGVLGNGLFNGFWGNGAMCHENTPVNRYEAQQSARIAELETEVKLRDANVYTMSEMGKLRDYVDSKFSAVHEELCQQRVYNATNIATVNCISGQVAQLMALTKTVIPNSSLCPGYGDVTVSITPTPTTAG
jgi:hypothetical protein